MNVNKNTSAGGIFIPCNYSKKLCTYVLIITCLG